MTGNLIETLKKLMEFLIMEAIFSIFLFELETYCQADFKS